MTNTLHQTLHLHLTTDKNRVVYEQIDSCVMGEPITLFAGDERRHIDCWFIKKNNRIAGDIKGQWKVSCAPLTPQEANTPCDLPSWNSADFLDWLEATAAPFWEGWQLPRIRMKTTHLPTTIPLDKYICQEERLDLGTMLANLATTTWVEGALITRNTDYSLKICKVYPRPQKTKLETSIPNPYNVVPRRLWDLVNNRVVDIDVFAKRGKNGEIISPRMPAGGYWAISHSWTSDMQRWMTPVNNYRWPVPLPVGVTLEDIRWEALRAGAVYCWLDVLCLRQRMEECSYGLKATDRKWVFVNNHHRHCSEPQHTEINQQQRLEEWALDVPTIGNNYRQATHVLRYFNGLGIPLSLSGWDGPRHWINRAWTLQESRPEHIMVNASIPEGTYLPLRAMVEIAGERRPIQDVLLSLARLIKDAEAEYVPHKSMLERTLPRWNANWWLPLPQHWQLDLPHSDLQRLTLGHDVQALVIAHFVFTVSQFMVRLGWETMTKSSLSRENYCLPRAMPTTLEGFSMLVESFVDWAVLLYCGRGAARKLLIWISSPWPGHSNTNTDIGVVGIIPGATAMVGIGGVWGLFKYTVSLIHMNLRVVSGPDCLAVELWGYLSFIALTVITAVTLRARLRDDWPWQPWIATTIAGCSEYWNSNVWQRLMCLRALAPNITRQTKRYCSILALAQEMSRRVASNERDKIWGLGYLMKCTNLPIYAETQPIEDAWLHLVSHLPYPAQLELLFNFPNPRSQEVGAHGTWVPTWEQVTSVVPDASVELQRPSWPPNWFFEEKVPTFPKLLVDLSHSKKYDEASRALLVPCCGRVLLCTQIRHCIAEGLGQGFDSRSAKLESYAVTIASRRDGSKRLIHYFYCPHNGSLLLADAEYSSEPLALPNQDNQIYLLISHGRDDEAGAISWVVARALHPLMASCREPERVFQAFYNPYIDEVKLSRELGPTIRKLTVDAFGLTEQEAVRTLVVQKLGVLVTDDMMPLTAPDMNFLLSSMSNVPVVFV